jgi:hypothetical protein
VKHQTIPSIPKQTSSRVDLVRGSPATAVVDAICRLCLLAATVDGAGSWPVALFDGITFSNLEPVECENCENPIKPISNQHVILFHSEISESSKLFRCVSTTQGRMEKELEYWRVQLQGLPALQALRLSPISDYYPILSQTTIPYYLN